MISKPEAIHLLHEAVDGGINLFDTARQYGASESIMGQAFQDRRDQVVICTKSRHLRNQSGVLPPPVKMKKIIENHYRKALQHCRPV
jgi:aryl-alcohol dehydrogenase-like predicted oxidoreductase